MNTAEMNRVLQTAMGYTHDTDCCGNCRSFRKADTEGPVQGGVQQPPLGARCAFNIITFPVSAGGHCKHFDARDLLNTNA